MTPSIAPASTPRQSNFSETYAKRPDDQPIVKLVHIVFVNQHVVDSPLKRSAIRAGKRVDLK